MSDQEQRPDGKQSDEQDKLVELMKDMPIAMMTTLSPSGPRTVPMARQEVDPGPQMWFITARDTQHVHDLASEPSLLLSFSSRDSWVALRGRGSVVEDRDKLAELWNTFAEAWLPGGPDDPDAVLIRVDVDQGEYWDTPGGRIASLISYAKTRITGTTFDADHGSVGGP